MGKAEIAMTPLQQWGEEVEDGAIYSVTLQRVRSEAVASKSSPPDDANPPECPFVQYRTCKRRTLRAATLPRLVKWLVSANVEGDLGYTSSFLATYRTFSTAEQILDLLLPLGPDKAVLQALELWLQDHAEDFWEPPEHPCLQRTLHFLQSSAPDSPAHALAKGLLQSFKEKQEDYGRVAEKAGGGEFPGMGLPQVIGEAAGPSDCEETPALLSFSVDEVAEQLTQMDVELFKAVRPFHCLGCVWSQRDKKENLHVAPSVRATVAQFNAVTSRVITSVLEDLTLRIPQRAHLLEKWINVAQRCRALRNFSSLHAILSALQSNSIYRLKRTWAAVNRDARSTFRKLSQIFSEANNHLNCREILLQEGGGAQGSTGGCSTPQTSPRASLKQRPQTRLVTPTIPYLGTFLTDLIMLDTALTDFLEGNLINFEKRRKVNPTQKTWKEEAAILSWIRQLQESCQGYNFCPDPSFHLAFHSYQQLSEEQSYRISRVIEPPADSCPNSPRLNRSLTKRFSSLLLGSEASATTLGPDKCGISPLGSCSSPNSEDDSSTPCSPTRGNPPCKNLPIGQLGTCLLETPPSSPISKQRGTESRIVRVSMENVHGNLYRSIVITSQDKTAAVLQRALQKHNLEGASPHNYQLLQLWGDGQELLIPEGANAFYAMNPAGPCDFLLRHKEGATHSSASGAAQPGSRAALQSTPVSKDLGTTSLAAASCPTSPPYSPPHPAPSSPASLFSSFPSVTPHLRPTSHRLTPPFPVPSSQLLGVLQSFDPPASSSPFLPLPPHLLPQELCSPPQHLLPPPLHRPQTPASGTQAAPLCHSLGTSFCPEPPRDCAVHHLAFPRGAGALPLPHSNREVGSQGHSEHL